MGSLSLPLSKFLAQRAELYAPPARKYLLLLLRDAAKFGQFRIATVERQRYLDLAIFAFDHVILVSALLRPCTRRFARIAAAISSLLIHLLGKRMAGLLQRFGVLADLS